MSMLLILPLPMQGPGQSRISGEQGHQGSPMPPNQSINFSKIEDQENQQLFQREVTPRFVASDFQRISEKIFDCIRLLQNCQIIYYANALISVSPSFSPQYFWASFFSLIRIWATSESECSQSLPQNPIIQLDSVKCKTYNLPDIRIPKYRWTRIPLLPDIGSCYKGYIEYNDTVNYIYHKVLFCLWHLSPWNPTRQTQGSLGLDGQLYVPTSKHCCCHDPITHLDETYKIPRICYPCTLGTRGPAPELVRMNIISTSSYHEPGISVAYNN